MYIQRAILLLILVSVIFLPSWLSWTLADPSAWHRPHMLWLATIVVVYLGARSVD